MELFVTNENELELVVGMSNDVALFPVHGQKQIKVLDLLMSNKVVYNSYILTSLMKELTLYTTTDSSFEITFNRSGFTENYIIEMPILNTVINRVEDQLINWYKDQENIHLYQILNNHYQLSQLDTGVTHLVDNVELSGKIVYKTNTLHLLITIENS